MGIKKPGSILSLYTIDSPKAISKPLMGFITIEWVAKNLDTNTIRASLPSLPELVR